MNVITLEKPKGIVIVARRPDGDQPRFEPLPNWDCADHRTDCRGDTECRGPGLFREDHGGWESPFEAEAVTDIEAGVRAAERIGYPVLVRPSYVLGGRAMQIVSNEERLRLSPDGGRSQWGQPCAGRSLYYGPRTGGGRHL